MQLMFHASIVIFSQLQPPILLSDENSYHNAGWDAYFAGYIFIKIAHVFSVKKYGEYVLFVHYVLH